MYLLTIYYRESHGNTSIYLTIISIRHNDPFDHMLIAQALSEPMRLISEDGVLPRYTPLVISI